MLGEPPAAAREYYSMQLFQAGYEWLAMISKVLIHTVKNALRYWARLFPCKFFCRKVVPILVLRNDPAFDLSFLIVATTMDADLEE